MRKDEHPRQAPLPHRPEAESPLRNMLLVATPLLQGDLFSKSVIYMCTHSPSGAMGIVINQRVPELHFNDLLAQLNLPKSAAKADPVIHFGGPVEQGRGFVLHSTDFIHADTIRLNRAMGITGTIDILRAISEGQGPKKILFALGYAGWGPGQLDAEIAANNWLAVPADDDLVFRDALSDKWAHALAKIGVDPLALSCEAGHA
ncbi:MAG: YqgE/AlgH family protein [Alphaproteobacteria bacterium]|nr:YqgE/AlgH family protein [Alphaproteobacteria bacterium]MDE2336286.1 YqgE/AlgH family protein [Alphaproteobacteria bacterium]